MKQYLIGYVAGTEAIRVGSIIMPFDSFPTLFGATKRIYEEKKLANIVILGITWLENGV